MTLRASCEGTCTVLWAVVMSRYHLVTVKQSRYCLVQITIRQWASLPSSLALKTRANMQDTCHPHQWMLWRWWWTEAPPLAPPISFAFFYHRFSWVLVCFHTFHAFYIAHALSWAVLGLLVERLRWNLWSSSSLDSWGNLFLVQQRNDGNTTKVHSSRHFLAYTTRRDRMYLICSGELSLLVAERSTHVWSFIHAVGFVS